MSAFIPPAACADETVAQLTGLPLLEPAEAPEPELAVLDEPDEQAAVSSAVLATTALAVITCRARKVVPPWPLPPCPGASEAIAG
jgi:hypothetical protein